MDETVKQHPMAARGRGSGSNASGRYEPMARIRIDDGWGAMDEAPPPIRTEVNRDTSRTILARNTSPDIGFDRSINPYRGCEHGCSYCFARPTHAWLGLSPGLDFETKLFVKPDAATLLARELRRPRYQCRPIAMGTNTDPYQPIERKFGVTREVLKVLQAFNHPVTIVTKSNLVLRDLDILADMAARNQAKVAISVTTLDRQLARRMEPRAPTPERRLAAIAGLSAAGVPAAVMVAPLIPALNDPEIEAIVAAAAGAGAGEAGYVLLRLPLEIKALWREWLETHVPDRASRVLRHIRDAHGGKDYDATFGKRQVGGGAYAELLRQRFEMACRRAGLNERSFDLDGSKFSPPATAGDQLNLL